MGHALDTCFLIDLARGDPGAVAKATSIEAIGSTSYVSTPVLFELMVGCFYRASIKEANRLRRAVSRLIVLPFDEVPARIAAEMQAELMRQGRVASDVDVMIAAVAAHHGHALVTRDEDLLALDEGFGLDLESY